MHFHERDFPKEYIIRKTSIKIRWQISSPCTNNRNINFPHLVWKQVGLQYPKQTPVFIQCQWSLCSKFRRIHQLQLRLSHGNHSVYRQTMTTMTAPKHNTTEKCWQSHKNKKQIGIVKDEENDVNVDHVYVSRSLVFKHLLHQMQHITLSASFWPQLLYQHWLRFHVFLSVHFQLQSRI